MGNSEFLFPWDTKCPPRQTKRKIEDLEETKFTVSFGVSHQELDMTQFRIRYASCEVYCWYDIWNESKSGYDCYFCLKVFIDNLDGNQWPKAIFQYPAGLWVKVQYISLPNFIIFTFEMWSLNSIWLHKSKQLKNKRFSSKRSTIMI